MKHLALKIAFGAACLLAQATLLAATPGGSAGNNAVTTDSPDAGGKTVTTGPFTVDNSVGGVIGISTDAAGKFELRHGYIGQLFEPAPLLTSAPTATPSSVTVNQTVTFAAMATDVDPVSYVWDFGDGNKDTSNSASVTHAYATAGVFTTTLTITDLEQQVTTGTVQVTVTPAGAAVPPGFDPLGFPLTLDQALGINPNDATASPFGGKPAGPVTPLTLTKLNIRLNFRTTGRDSIQAQGTLPIPSGFTVAGQQFVIYAGGVANTVKLTSKGKGTVGKTVAVTMAIKSKKGVVSAQTSKFTVKLAGAFVTTLAGAGLTNTSVKNGMVSVDVIVLFNTTFFEKIQLQSYTARQGATGSTK